MWRQNVNIIIWIRCNDQHYRKLSNRIIKSIGMMTLTTIVDIWGSTELGNRWLVCVCVCCYIDRYVIAVYGYNTRPLPIPVDVASKWRSPSRLGSSCARIWSPRFCSDTTADSCPSWPRHSIFSPRPATLPRYLRKKKQMLWWSIRRRTKRVTFRGINRRQNINVFVCVHTAYVYTKTRDVFETTLVIYTYENIGAKTYTLKSLTDASPHRADVSIRQEIRFPGSGSSE